MCGEICITDSEYGAVGDAYMNDAHECSIDTGAPSGQMRIFGVARYINADVGRSVEVDGADAGNLGSFPITAVNMSQDYIDVANANAVIPDSHNGGIQVRIWSKIGSDGPPTDDGPAIQAAIDAAMERHGGELVFPATAAGGLFYQQTRCLVIPQDAIDQPHMVFRGVGGGIVVNVGFSSNNGFGFYMGNVERAQFNDMLFYPGTREWYDGYHATSVIRAHDVVSLELWGTQFYALSCNGPIVQATAIENVFQQCCFFGGRAPQGEGVVRANGFTAHLINTHFRDYGNSRGLYWSITGADAWVAGKDPETARYDANGQNTLRLSGCTFDEGAGAAVRVSSGNANRYSRVLLEDLNVYQNETSGGRSFAVAQANVLEIRRCGLAKRFSQTAIELQDVKRALISGLQKDPTESGTLDMTFDADCERVDFERSSGQYDTLTYDPQCTTVTELAP